jgi:GWxTD domain-containing protein
VGARAVAGVAAAILTGVCVFSRPALSTPGPGAAVTEPAPFPDPARLKELRLRIREDRTDVEARRALADLLGDSPTIEGRREAAEALVEALLVDEDDPDLWLSLARVRERQKFLGESRGAYLRAAAIAPRRFEIWNELAAQELLRYQRFHFDTYRISADRSNRTALDIDPEAPGAVWRQLRLEYLAGRTGGVDSLARIWRRLAPGDPWPRLVRGLRWLEEDDFARAEREFEAGLALLDSLGRREFETLGTVDAEEDRLSGESADSVRYVTDYWRWRDPTPADLTNPRLLEHYARMVQAEICFSLEDRGLRGWRHAPGALLVKYGVPPGWTYARDVRRGGASRLSASVAYAPRSLVVRYGSPETDITFRLIDFAMNGVYVHPPSTFNAVDRFRAAHPAFYADPFEDPDRDQEVEILRFLDREGRGRTELLVALAESEWGGEVLAEPERLVSRVGIYDPRWTIREEDIRDWTPFRRGPDRRLLGRFPFEGLRDSLIVGIETTDLDGTGRSARFFPLSPAPDDGVGPLLSDIAFLREPRFDDEVATYAWADGTALPNPGHRYAPGEQIAIAFETYHLALDETGNHRVEIRITVNRVTRSGLQRIVFGSGAYQSELVFDGSAAGDRLEQLLGLALPVLREGDYAVGVEVRDRITGLSDAGRVDFTVRLPRGDVE